MLIFASLLTMFLHTTSSAPLETIVESPQALQSAIQAKSPFIRITQHLFLTDLNKGTSDEGKLIFPDDMVDMVIWVRPRL